MPNFRFNAKKLFATYPQANGLSKDIILEFYQRLNCTSYTIARELHEDGNEHFHCLIEWQTPYDCRDERRFDINGHHPNIQTARNPKAVHSYIIKDGDYITNKTYDDTSNSWADLAACNTVGQFWELAERKHARDFIVNHEKLEYYATKRFKTETTEYVPTYTEFKPPEPVMNWIETEYPKVSVRRSSLPISSED